jgi:hypothetical protein
MKKILKYIKYLGISSLIFLVSFILGQKNTKEYSFTSLVHADIPTGGGFTGDGCTDSGASDGGAAGGDGGDGTDGTSSDGGASGADATAYMDDGTNNNQHTL